MKYKYSNYNIITPVFNNEQRVIYNLLTEKFALINNKIYDLISCNNLPTENEIIDKLRLIGVLIEGDKDEIKFILEENETTIENRNVLSFTILPSSNCQLGCHYCGQVHDKTKLNVSTHDAILKTIRELIPNKTHLSIGWFGAEPLLGIDTIVKLSPYLREISKEFNCTFNSRITTNGLLLNKKNIQILLENGINDITISIDGSKEYHDLRRPTKGGDGSYDVIIKNLETLFNYLKSHQKYKIDLAIRVNVDRYNRDGVVPLLENLKKIGCQNLITEWDIAPIHSWGNDADKRALTFEEYSNFDLDITIKLLEMELIKNVVFPGRVKIMCLAVTPDSLYLDASGKVYDCSEIPLVPVHDDKYLLGYIGDKTSILNKNRHHTEWNKEIKEGKTPCLECKILPICGGGCPKAWKEGYTPCPSFKYNIEELALLGYLYSTKKDFLTTHAN